MIPPFKRIIKNWNGKKKFGFISVNNEVCKTNKKINLI